MSEEKGKAIFLTFILLGIMLHNNLCHATTYIVGDSTGWRFNVAGWEKGKQFKAGDTLVFNYNPAIHDVAAVNRAGYAGCTTPPGAKIYQTGKDQIKLAKGQNFFICSIPGHCQSGMKIAITAT